MNPSSLKNNNNNNNKTLIKTSLHGTYIAKEVKKRQIIGYNYLVVEPKKILKRV